MQSTHAAFTLITTAKINELATTAYLYDHKKTGAKILSLVNDDENKTFAITFTTPPEDSSGVTHIIEHSVLCGSTKYRLKEPFVELIKGSLNTFLNAFTYPDKTSYPVASTNSKDFYNLIDVYMDAVFHPLLTQETLAQEGWHYDLESPDGTLQYKGVVYNEMKGAYSSADRAMYDLLQQGLLPDTPYRHDSGGNPDVIPTLTYEYFTAYHAKHYHPSHALIVFSGDDDPQQRLVLMDSYLRDYQRHEETISLAIQPPFPTPKTCTGTYAIGASEDPTQKSMISLGWAFPPIASHTETLPLKVLGHILLATPASPLRKALIDSGLGEDLTPSGLESELQQMLFTVGLRGVKQGTESQVEHCILDTLTTLAREGIPQTTIDAALHSIEFSLREQNTGSFPRGLAMTYTALASWLYGRDPIDALSFAAPLAALKKRLSQGERVFESLITRYLLENTHRVTVLLTADPTYNSTQEQRELQRLQEYRQTLSKEQEQAIITKTHALQELQERADAPEALAALPRLRVTDLDPLQKVIPTKEYQEAEATILTHALPTNGVIYLDLAFDLSMVPETLLPFVPLFARGLMETGTHKDDFVRFTERIQQHSGGIWTQILVGAQEGKAEPVSRLVYRAKFLPEHLDAVLSIMLESIEEANLDDQTRFGQMLLEERSAYESDLAESGHTYADLRIRSQFHQADWLNEQFSGLTHYQWLRGIADGFPAHWQTLETAFATLRAAIFTRHHFIANITTEEEICTTVQTALQSWIENLPTKVPPAASWPALPQRGNELLIVPTLVNYVAKGANLYAKGYTFSGSDIVVNRYLRTAWLWEQVRMKGGAYGAFSTFDTLTGTMTFASYRDPQLEETLQRYDQTQQFLEHLSISPQELEKAIIGTISDVDRYQLPDAKGFTALTRYLAGITHERRQAIREEILATTPGAFSRYAEAIEIIKEHGVIAATVSKQVAEQTSLTADHIDVLSDK